MPSAFTPSCYSFSEYCPSWPDDFEREAERWRAFLSGDLVAIHHIGSTSVPGLAAKPIIDLMPVVRAIEQVDALESAIVTAGYRAWGEYHIAGRRFFTKDDQGMRTHNVHIFGEGHPAIVRHLAFRDYLRAHALVRDEYAQIKRAAYEQHPVDIAAYCNAKDPFIKRVECKAMEWYHHRSSRCH